MKKTFNPWTSMRLIAIKDYSADPRYIIIGLTGYQLEVHVLSPITLGQTRDIVIRWMNEFNHVLNASPQQYYEENFLGEGTLTGSNLEKVLDEALTLDEFAKTGLDAKEENVGLYFTYKELILRNFNALLHGLDNEYTIQPIQSKALN